MALETDTRGWIMACVSGVACVAGASIICVDLLVQQIPRYRHWRIQDSNAFLSSSLSLSFGVMLYSSLYNMLPSAKASLIQGGLSPTMASYVLIGCFLGGVVGIKIVSSFIHRYMPSHVVDCDHTHEEPEEEHEEFLHDHDHEHTENWNHHHHHHHHHEDEDEETPLLSRSSTTERRPRTTPAETQLRPDAPSLLTPPPAASQQELRRPSLKPSITRAVTTFIRGGECGEFGQCHGYSELCGQECFKALSRAQSHAGHKRPGGGPHRSSIFRGPLSSPGEGGRQDAVESLESSLTSEHSAQGQRRWSSRRSSQTHHHHAGHGQANGNGTAHKPAASVASDAQNHHHHVPANAFLAIGLQTSIAIALHKLPEGFITYATNHANPQLGVAVFVALFIHNITEGFAMALPLYLAVGSRIKAMFWSSLLGGVSQPLGAGIAALWFSVAGRHDRTPSEGVYGAMFAVTAGIMASVALQLFSESLGLTHNKNLCTTFAFVGMGVLGISNALTA